MLSITKNNGQRANTFSRLQREENVFKRSTALTYGYPFRWLLTPSLPLGFPRTSIRWGMQTLNGKAQNVFLPTNMPVQRVFFFSQYSLHYSPWIFHFEGRRRLGRVESGNNRVCTMLMDKVGFSPVSLPCSYTGYLLWLMQQPHPPTPPKNIVCPAFISQSLKRYKSERKKAVSF